MVDGAGTANQRFAVATADKESVGGAWLPGSGRTPANAAQNRRKMRRTEVQKRNKPAECQESIALVPIVTQLLFHDELLFYDIGFISWIQGNGNLRLSIKPKPAAAKVLPVTPKSGFTSSPGSSLSITSTSCARPLHGPPLRTLVRPSYKCVWLPGPGTAPDLLALVISMQTPR